MAIDRSFEAAFMKAIRGLEVRQKDLRHPKFQAQDDVELEAAVKQPTDERLWAIAEALRRDWSVDRVNKICKVDKWFLRKMLKLIVVEKELANAKASGADLEDLIYRAFMIGFPSPAILDIAKTDDQDFNDNLKAVIDNLKVKPVFKMVDTCAGEFESKTPYYYGTFESQDDVVRV